LDVLDLPGVVVTDRNAAADLCLFSAPPEGLERLDFELVFARYWTHSGDPVAERYHKAVKCAEVLVPDCVEPRYIRGVYCSCASSVSVARETGLEVTEMPDLFFQQEVP